MRTLLALLALARIASAQPSLPARGWDTYQVIMWSTGSPRDPAQWIDSLRAMGVTAEECSGCNAAPFVNANFGFYVENLIPELAFLHDRQALYQADWDGYTKAPHDKKYLLRKPSLNDPAFWSTARPRLQALVRPYVSRQPLLYQLRDELSLGSYASPFDYDFDPHALADFRVWLQGVYGSLDALNQEWDTAWSNWDDVQPFDTYEIKDRERAALAAGQPENYAPWADHRAFMDLTFAQSLDRLRGYIRELDAVTPVGIEGAQMPSAWGGYDLWRLSQAVDWVEPYDIANAREIWRSFLPPGTVILTTVFGSDLPHIRQRLWWLLLQGGRGAIIWDDDTGRAILKDQDGAPLTGRGRGLAQVMAELKAAAPQIFRLRRLDDRIAIHYSQAGIRAHWMFDSREDKDTWPRRFSSYEATFSRLARVRDSFVKVIEDLGLEANFVSYEQIENDELLGSGYQVLLLPQSVAMSAEECRRIRAFVEAGGTVIADNMAATMDEHGRRLSRGRLDGLFGIQRPALGWRPKGAGGSAGDLPGFDPDLQLTTGTARRQTDTGVPIVVVNQAGDGRAIYLNVDMHDYARLRLTPPAGAAVRDLFASLLAESGITPAVSAVDPDGGSAVPCVRITRYSGDDGAYVALMRNPEFEAASLKPNGYPDNSAIEVPVRIRVIFDQVYGVSNALTGESLGSTDQVVTELDPFGPAILRLTANSQAGPMARARRRLPQPPPPRRAAR